MARRVIALLGEPTIGPDEDKAAEAITPGNLLNWDGSGDLIKHDVAGGRAEPIFALERDEMGKDIDQPYAVGDAVKVGAFAKGMRVLAIVAAGAPAIAKGDWLESAGDGTLRKATTLTKLTRAGGHTGTANGELQDVTSSHSEAALENNFEEVALKLDALLDGGHKGLIGRALEAVDNSGGSAAVRLRIRVV